MVGSYVTVALAVKLVARNFEADSSAVAVLAVKYYITDSFELVVRYYMTDS